MLLPISRFSGLQRAYKIGANSEAQLRYSNPLNQTKARTLEGKNKCSLAACAGAAPSQQVVSVLELCARLYAARCIEVDIGWFIGEGVLPAQVGEGGGSGARGRTS